MSTKKNLTRIRTKVQTKFTCVTKREIFTDLCMSENTKGPWTVDLTAKFNIAHFVAFLAEFANACLVEFA